MARTSVVGARELKTRLGKYLNRVRRGETLLVTDRSEPVAELRPVRDGATPAQAALSKAAASGLVTLPTRPGTGDFRPIRSRGVTASAAIAHDRAERG
jgi:prevent-host-death family protein